MYPGHTYQFMPTQRWTVVRRMPQPINTLAQTPLSSAGIKKYSRAELLVRRHRSPGPEPPSGEAYTVLLNSRIRSPLPVIQIRLLLWITEYDMVFLETFVAVVKAVTHNTVTRVFYFLWRCNLHSCAVETCPRDRITQAITSCDIEYEMRWERRQQRPSLLEVWVWGYYIFLVWPFKN